MRSEVKDELDIEYEDRVRKIRQAAAAALKELDQLHSAGYVSRAVLDAGVARIAREKLHPCGCDLVFHWRGDRTTRFLISPENRERIRSN